MRACSPAQRLRSCFSSLNLSSRDEGAQAEQITLILLVHVEQSRCSNACSNSQHATQRHRRNQMRIRCQPQLGGLCQAAPERTILDAHLSPPPFNRASCAVTSVDHTPSDLECQLDSTNIHCDRHPTCALIVIFQI